MKSSIKKYIKNNLVVFSINVNQKQHKNGSWKKDIEFPSKWTDFTLSTSYYNEEYNGVALLTCKINNIIVIDIDNVEHWDQFLKENNQKEPNTVKVISGSGGIHYYFEHDIDLENVTSKDHCFSKDYDIDIKTNGGCIIVPPTKYFNKNLNKDVEYVWEKNIFDNEPIKMPTWMKNLLLEKKVLKIEKEINYELQNLEPNQEESELTYSINDIETLINTLSINRYENYNDWISVGMCLYNLDNKYLLIWLKWSQQSEKYKDGDCEDKWKSFKKTKDGLKIGSLLMWSKLDNPLKYDDFIRKKKMSNIIKQKYPLENLILGNRQDLDSKNCFIHLKNSDCLIKGGNHVDMPNSMYIDILDKFMTIKCRHAECFSKKYPCDHILINKNEMNVVFNVTINNVKDDDDLVEFQQIEIYDDPKLNELVFNSLNGEPFQLAEIIYYYYENEFRFDEISYGRSSIDIDDCYCL